MAVQKTTVYLDAEDYRKLKAIAKAERRAPADLVREAVAEYAGKHARRVAARSIGVGRSKRGDVSERAEELLAGFGRSR
jgi:predicted transcriptional regulator